MASNVAVSISFILNNEPMSIVIDTVNDTSITTASDITEHPVVSGDIIADHMIRQPISMNLSGEFSINGSQAIVVSKEGAALADVERLFETIKNQAILCTIVKIVQEGQTLSPKFTIRENMALNNIQWTERINSLGFNFSFRQIMTADVVNYDVDIDDAYLPNITEPKPLSFTDALLDMDAVMRRCVEIFDETEILDKELVKAFSSLGVSALIGIGIGLAAAKIAVTTFAVSVPVAGWIVGAVVLITTLTYGLYKAITNSKKYKIKRFEHHLSKKKNEKEWRRFCECLEELKRHFEELNNQMKVWQISSNQEQECMVSVANTYAVFTFKKNNTNGTYDVIVEDVNGEQIGKTFNLAGALTDISQCTNSNHISKIGNTWQYIIRTGEDTKDLTSYCILSSTIDMSEFSKLIDEIVKDYILK